MTKTAVFPGSFDPITVGHASIVQRALGLFDEIIIGIGVNSTKKYLFELEQRKRFIAATFEGESKVRIETYEGLTVDFCKRVEATYIIRGLRTAADLEFEQPIAQMNRKMSDVETVFLITEPELSAINSTIVRDIYRNGGDIPKFVPDGVQL